MDVCLLVILLQHGGEIRQPVSCDCIVGAASSLLIQRDVVILTEMRGSVSRQPGHLRDYMFLERVPANCIYIGVAQNDYLPG